MYPFHYEYQEFPCQCNQCAKKLYANPMDTLYALLHLLACAMRKEEDDIIMRETHLGMAMIIPISSIDLSMVTTFEEMTGLQHALEQADQTYQHFPLITKLIEQVGRLAHSLNRRRRFSFTLFHFERLSAGCYELQES